MGNEKYDLDVVQLTEKIMAVLLTGGDPRNLQDQLQKLLDKRANEKTVSKV